MPISTKNIGVTKIPDNNSKRDLIMELIKHHKELFERKDFDIWWCRDSAPSGVDDDWFIKYKSFYKILTELNEIYE